MDLFRWFRFIWAAGVPWNRATRIEARDFCRWMLVAGKPSRPHWRSPDATSAASGEAYAPSVQAHFLNIRGTMAGGKAGLGGWNWTRNKAFIDDAIAAGREIRMVTDPEALLYSGGNTYQRELNYLVDNGFGWRQVDDYWQVIRVRPTSWRF
jgi:hypothetical protein